MTLLLSIDPGKSTGWSVWEYDALTPLRHLAHGTTPDGLRGFLQWWNTSWTAQHFRTYGGDLVAEDFILDGRTLIPNTMPLEILGALEVLWPGYARQRNVMKAHVTDDTLKHLDLWWKGKGHDRDSARHAIAFMKVRRHAPTLRWLSGRDVTQTAHQGDVTQIAHEREENE